MPIQSYSYTKKEKYRGKLIDEFDEFKMSL